MGTREEYVAVLQEDISHNNKMNKEGQKFHQYVNAIIAAMGAAVIGSILAWTSPMVPLLENENSTSPVHSDPEENAWVASLVPIGAMIGALPAGLFANVIGRKRTLVAFSIPWIACWTTVLFAKSINTLYIARFVSGVVVGVMSTVIPMYVAEICEVSIRGALGSYFQLFMTIGVLFSYTFGALESYMALAVACLSLSIVYFLSLLTIPESPLHLVVKGRKIDAEKSLRRLRGDQYDIQSELSEMRKNLESSQKQKFSLSMLNKKANRKALIIGFGLMVFQQLSGVNAVIFFSGTIFQDAGSSLPSAVSSIILGVVQCVATFFSGVLMDKAGRRLLLLSSDFVMAMCLAILGGNFWLREHGYDVSSIGWVPLSSLLAFIVMFSLGIGPIPWMMTGEVFSPEIKGFATGIAVALNWIQAFMVTRFFRDMSAAIGSSFTFWIFAGVCFTGTAFIFFIVPETKGKTLQTIQDELAGKKSRNENGV